MLCREYESVLANFENRYQRALSEDMLGVRVSPAIKTAIERHAQKRKITVAEWLREAIADQLNAENRVEQLRAELLKAQQAHAADVDIKLTDFGQKLDKFLAQLVPGND